LKKKNGDGRIPMSKEGGKKMTATSLVRPQAKAVLGNTGLSKS